MDQAARDRIAAHRQRLSGNIGVASRSQASIVNLDWFAEVGECQYRSGPEQRLSCGCGGSGVVVAMTCTESPDTECVATQASRAKLLKNHRDMYQSIRVCEDCPFSQSPVNAADTALHVV